MMQSESLMPKCITFTQANIIYNSRLFWRELIFWSRAFFDSVYNDIGNEREVFTQLFNMPNSYACSLKLIFARQTVERYVSFFNRYAITLRELIVASSTGDVDAINEKVTGLYNIVKAQSAFLAEIFPALDQAVIEEMLTNLVTLQIEEINSYILEDFDSQLRIFDELLSLTDSIADYLSYGIINLIAAPVSQNFLEEQGNGICIDYDEFNVIMESALFWVNLILWFREYRISVMADLGNQEELHKRLIQTTVDYKDSVKGIIGEDIASYQISLVQEYIDLMNQLLDARLAGNIEEMDRIYKLTIDNIQKRGDLLNASIPLQSGLNWTNELTKLHVHLIDMSTQFLTGDYSRAIEVFNGLINQAENLGSELARIMAEAFIQNTDFTAL